MKMVDIKDIGVKYVMLSSGKYLVGDKVITVSGFYEKKVQVKDGIDIRKITETKIITKYVKDEEEMSFEEYNNIEAKLLKDRWWDEDDYIHWDNLESEYEYKKLTTYWQPVYKTIQEFSEPLKVEEVTELKYDTGNKFIKNIFLNGENTEDISLYTYNLPEARISIVSEIFKSLGFEYEDNISYMRTEGKKIWSNSTHSVIRYVVAFGGYIFGDSWGNKYTPRGTLEDMQKKYEDDYNKIKKIIMTHYNKTFGKIDKDKFDFVGLIDNLNSLRNTVRDIDSKVKTQGYQTKAINKLDRMIQEINGMFK